MKRHRSRNLTSGAAQDSSWALIPHITPRYLAHLDIPKLRTLIPCLRNEARGVPCKHHNFHEHGHGRVDIKGGGGDIIGEGTVQMDRSGQPKTEQA
eukprot:4204594-Pyramimonas_sp.AAC.1